MEEIQQALYLKSQLDLLRPIDKVQEARIIQKFRLDWNYHSNHLEGNSLTYGETKALILFGVTAQGKPLKDTLEITGHNEAINWVLEMVSGDRTLTENFIRELHSLLLKDSYKESKNADGKIVPRKITSGKYKTTPNHVETATKEIFYFASPEETPAKMTELLDWYKEKTEEKEPNPILIAAEFHYKFIRIHPFDDGNGRTARILMNFILMQFGFPPVIIKTEDKANYFAALQMADAGNLEPFITYIAVNLNRSLQIMIAGANGENIEDDDDLDKEIALLEQKLNNVGERTNIPKSNEIVLITFEYFINKISESFLKKISKIDKMYIKRDIYYFYFSGFRNTNCNFDYIKENILKLQTIGFGFFFKNFNTTGFGQFSFKNEFNIIFSEIGYAVILSNERIIEKPYGLELTDSEIDKIVKSEVKRHKDFIDQKIAEKENK